MIENFRRGYNTFLVTTSVLERGVTVKNLQVIVFNADDPIYNHGTLIQIAGRVGRKKDAPEGKVIFLAHRKTIDMEKAIESIENANKDLKNEDTG